MAGRRPKVGPEIQANVKVDLSRFEKALAGLGQSIREAIVDEALKSGGDVIRKAAMARAPGPHIVVEKMGGKKLGSGVGTGLMKKEISYGGSYVVVGPDKDHWYYRFSELGTKEHGVSKRKRTTRRQALARAKVKAKVAKTLTAGTAPAMKMVVSGQTFFARKVRGFASKPFMKPAAEQGPEAVRVIGKVLSSEMEKVRT